MTGANVDDPNITEGKKHYIFSATGNIMIASTDVDSSNVDDKVRSVFNEVSVFFAAMTKAISTTKRPGTDENYSIYNYAALEKVIDGSGCFIHCTQEDIHFTSTSVGADFSKELLTALLGLPTGGGALAFAQAMISSVGQEGLKLSADTKSTESKVGNIVFVCEFLFGMPIISAMVVYVDSKQNSQVFKAGPCVSVQHDKTTLTMHKDVYMFVTPTFIKSYAADLDSIITSSDYNKFVDYLKSLLTDEIVVEGIYQENQTVDKLIVGGTYAIKGNNFGSTSGTLTLGSTPLDTSNWTNQEVEFTAPGVTLEAQQLIITRSDKKAKMVGSYAVVKNENS